MKKMHLDEITTRLYETLLERFGEPLDQACHEDDMDEGEYCKFEDESDADDKRKGMTKKGAQSWVKGTKKFSDKVAKAKKAGMKNPEGFAAWAQHKATGKWPSEQ